MFPNQQAGNPVDQFAKDVAGGMSGVTQAAPMLDKISPIVEYLLQMLQGQQAPQPAYKSSEMTGPYRGPMPAQQQQQPGQGLRKQIMGPRPEY